MTTPPWAAALVAALLVATPALAEERQDPRCAGFGEGFVYAESIASCVRIGGYVRLDAGFGHGGLGRRSQALGLGSEGQVGVEVDKDTELGPFRAVVQPRGVLQNQLR